MNGLKNALLMADNTDSPILEDSRSLLERYRFSDDYVSQFTDTVEGILNDYAALYGEDIEIAYIIAKRPFRVELKVFLEGDRFDPFANGENAQGRFFDNLSSMNLNNESIRVSKKYVRGCNVISVSIPMKLKQRKAIADPVLLAVVLGILCGLLCQQLPPEVNSFVVDKLASPILSIILNLLAGIMGPVIFISLTTSILAFDSINEFTSMGFKLVKRFVLITLFLMAVSFAVSAVFFVATGKGTVDIVPDQLIGLLLNIIPTNLVKPFLDNNTPQLVVLGFATGSTLLLLGDRVKELNAILIQANEFIMNLMSIVLTVVPAIPFISLMTNIASGNIGEILGGWKFIVASYIVFTICVAVKLVKASLATKLKVSELWKKMNPAVKTAFTTGSTSAAIKQAYEISEKDFNIKREFSSLWIPMSSAMLSPKTTVTLVLATCMMAEITDMAITSSFILVLALITLELSLASPGTTSALVIMFETLAMPTSYVGLFTAYRVLTANFNAGAVEAYCLLEEVEAAHKLGGIKTAKDSNVALPADF